MPMRIIEQSTFQLPKEAVEILQDSFPQLPKEINLLILDFAPDLLYFEALQLEKLNFSNWKHPLYPGMQTCFLKAAKKNHKDAQYRLANLYLHDSRLRPHPATELALPWLTKQPIKAIQAQSNS